MKASWRDLAIETPIQEGASSVQIDPRPLYHHGLVERAVAYLQTRNPELFPFAARFDEAREEAFVNDLRMGLSDLVESGAKRGTSSTGFITSDRRLLEVVEDWASANGGWPVGQDPTNPDGVGGTAPFDGKPVY
jgi:hypothetical protein